MAEIRRRNLHAGDGDGGSGDADMKEGVKKIPETTTAESSDHVNIIKCFFFPLIQLTLSYSIHLFAKM